MATDRHVRVAAILKNGQVRTAEAPLDPGVVVQGEVVDIDALAAAIKTAVGSERFGTRSVVVGVAGRDAVTRQVELPTMADKDLRSALNFELNDMLPFPPSEAVVDFVRVEDVTDENDRAVARLLAVAIHRSAVDPLIEAVRRSGLTPVALDLAAFGLVRSAWSGGAEQVGATALVHLGESTMTVVVVDGDAVRFTRQVGVVDDAESGAADLDADLAFVERFRSGSTAAKGSTATIERVDPIVAAVAGTLEYYSLQAGATPVETVSLFGDLHRANRIEASLGSALGDHVTVGVLGETDDDVTDLERHTRSEFAPVIGLVLDPATTEHGPARLDLLPPPPPMPVKSVVVRAVVLAMVVGALGWFALDGVGPDRVGAAEEAESAEAAIAQLEARLERLSDARSNAVELKQGDARIASIAEKRVPWEMLLAQIRTTIPADTVLLSMSASSAVKTATGTTPGTIELTAQSPTSASVSAWLLALSSVEGVKRPWLSAAGTVDVDGAPGVVTFTISLELEKDLSDIVPPAGIPASSTGGAAIPGPAPSTEDTPIGEASSGEPATGSSGAGTGASTRAGSTLSSTPLPDELPFLEPEIASPAPEPQPDAEPEPPIEPEPEVEP